MGAFSLSSLREAGVEVSDVKVIDGAVNQFAVILIDKTTGERTIIWKRDDSLKMLPEEVPVDSLTGGRFLLLDGHDAPAAARAAGVASEAGVCVVIDAETVKEGTREMVARSRCVVASRDFPERFTGKRDLREALKDIHGLGPLCVAATLGREGAICLHNGEFVESRGFRVNCIDSTGAGDVFHAGFVYGLAVDWDIGQVLDFSNAAAALNCTALGARAGIRNVDEIFNLIETGERW